MEITSPIGYTTYSFTVRLSPHEAKLINDDLLSSTPLHRLSKPTIDLKDTIASIASQEPKE